MKLYRNNQYPNRWYAHSRETGWVMFPAEPGGWSKGEHARGVDPMYTHEVPIACAANTGIAIEAPFSPDAGLSVAA
jgi:hypothetical protein